MEDCSSREVVIIGCGSSGLLQVPEEARLWLAGQGIAFFALPTQAACDRYNEVAGSGKVVAALHLTC